MKVYTISRPFTNQNLSVRYKKNQAGTVKEELIACAAFMLIEKAQAEAVTECGLINVRRHFFVA